MVKTILIYLVDWNFGNIQSNLLLEASHTFSQLLIFMTQYDMLWGKLISQSPWTSPTIIIVSYLSLFTSIQPKYITIFYSLHYNEYQIMFK